MTSYGLFVLVPALKSIIQRVFTGGSVCTIYAEAMPNFSGQRAQSGSAYSLSGCFRNGCPDAAEIRINILCHISFVDLAGVGGNRTHRGRAAPATGFEDANWPFQPILSNLS
jgi:hypothetical protein